MPDDVVEMFGCWIPSGFPLAGCYAMTARCSIGCHTLARVVTAEDIELAKADIIALRTEAFRETFKAVHVG